MWGNMAETELARDRRIDRLVHELGKSSMMFSRTNANRRDHMASSSSMTEPTYPVAMNQAAPTTQALESSWSGPILSKRKWTSGKDNSALIERLTSGDQEAFETIYNLYSPKLFKIAFKILGQAADAEDVIQEVFWTAYKKIKTFCGNAQLSTWLYRLTVNAALGKIRREKRSKETAYEEYLPKFQADGHHLVRPVVDWSDTLDEKYAKREVQELLKVALDELKPVDKAVVILSDLEGL